MYSNVFVSGEFVIFVGLLLLARFGWFFQELIVRVLHEAHIPT